MAENSNHVNAEDLEVEGTTDAQYVTVDGVKIRLARPLELDFDWVGNHSIVRQLHASWYCANDGDKPMNPRLVGKPGLGKTALAYCAGKMLNQDVYFFQATSDTTPNDVLINPVLKETGKDEASIEYVASTLITAMIVGGIAVLDEGNRMQEKAWASLAPLLDSRRYIESITVGLLIKAHKDFRIVTTMNDDASCFDLPEYIQSRLHPLISLDFPERSEERKILDVNLPYTNAEVLDYVSDFLTVARKEGDEFSVRDGIHVAQYAGKIVDFEEMQGREVDPGDAVITAVEQILGIKPARYIKQIIWSERAA